MAKKKSEDDEMVSKKKIRVVAVFILLLIISKSILESLIKEPYSQSPLVCSSKETTASSNFLSFEQK